MGWEEANMFRFGSRILRGIRLWIRLHVTGALKGFAACGEPTQIADDKQWATSMPAQRDGGQSFLSRHDDAATHFCLQPRVSATSQLALREYTGNRPCCCLLLLLLSSSNWAAKTALPWGWFGLGYGYQRVFSHGSSVKNCRIWMPIGAGTCGWASLNSKELWHLEPWEQPGKKYSMRRVR